MEMPVFVVKSSRARVPARELPWGSRAGDHVQRLKWPGMTMDFKLPPAAQRPAGLRAGEQVEIDFQLREGSEPQITAMRRQAQATQGKKP